MKYLLAANDKQLGICLRMLYADGIQGVVETVMNGKGKIEFHVSADLEGEELIVYQERYNILTS